MPHTSKGYGDRYCSERDARRKQTVRDFIVQYKPDVCISGHIHESRGKDKVGDTIVLNAGMFRDGWYIEIDIDNGGISATLKSVA